MEKNPKKFKIDISEVGDRRQFLERTKTTVKVCMHFLIENLSCFYTINCTCGLFYMFLQTRCATGDNILANVLFVRAPGNARALGESDAKPLPVQQW